MVRRSRLNLISLIMSVIMTVMFLSVPSGADLFGNGLSASRTDLSLGETFTLYINIPSESQLTERHDADSLNFKVYYDSDVVDIIKNPDSLDFLNVPSGNIHIKEAYCGSDAGGSFFSFAASSTACNIPTKNGMRLTATFKVRTDTKKSYATFSLAEHVLGYTDENTDPVSIVDMWRNVTTPDLQIPIPENIIPDTATKGGLKLSSPTAYTGSVFTADIIIPEISKIIDTAQLTLTYRPEFFELISVNEGKSGLSASADKNSGIISFTPSNSSTDLRNGATITVTFKVNKSTPPADYLFRLSRSELIYRGHSLWNPESITAELTVLSPDGVFPGYGGGIYLSSDYTTSGTEFDVYIKVPATDFSAEKVKIRIEYSGKAFDLRSWDVPSSSVAVDYGSGYFDFIASNADINLRYGLLFKAHMRTNYNSTSGKYSFRLVQNEISSSKIDHTLWTTINNIAYINVVSEYAVTTRDPYVTMDQRTTTITSSPIPYATVSDADTTRPFVTNGTRNDDDDNSDGIYDPDDNDNNDDPYDDGPDNDGIFDPDDIDNDTTRPTGSDVHIYIDPNISGVNNRKISAQTMTEFFDGDIIIYLKNTSSADSNAKTAMKALNISGGKYYAFDISVLDRSSGRYIRSINDGFIDFRIPLPNTFAGYTGSIDIYHIENGRPELINSSIVNDGGIQRISFRANSFSPYMLVLRPVGGSYTGGSVNNGNTVVTTAYIVQNTNGNNISDKTSAGNKQDIKGEPDKGEPDTSGSVRPANPHTGYILAVTIPSAAAVCMYLVRKEKRKRCSKR